MPSHRLIPLLAAAAVLTAGCTAGGSNVESDPMDVALSGMQGLVPEGGAARGLPQHLLPADFGQADYVPPRGTCASEMRDEERPDVHLRLERAHLRLDWAQRKQGSRTTTVEKRVPEGAYRVQPDTAYGLEPGQKLRVDCFVGEALTIVAPLERT